MAVAGFDSFESFVSNFPATGAFDSSFFGGSDFAEASFFISPDGFEGSVFPDEAPVFKADDGATSLSF